MPRHPALPISLYLKDRVVLLVGDGGGADERAARLAAAGARTQHITKDAWQPELCGDAFIVIANDDDDGFNRSVAAQARAKGCLSYAHDRPELSDFAMPALIRRGPLAIAISTDAAAPALSRRLREELEKLLDSAGERLLSLIGHLEARRQSMARGDSRKASLYRDASSLEIRGALHIGDFDGGHSDGGDGDGGG